MAFKICFITLKLTAVNDLLVTEIVRKLTKLFFKIQNKYVYNFFTKFSAKYFVYIVEICFDLGL